MERASGKRARPGCEPDDIGRRADHKRARLGPEAHGTLQRRETGAIEQLEPTRAQLADSISRLRTLRGFRRQQREHRDLLLERTGRRRLRDYLAMAEHNVLAEACGHHALVFVEARDHAESNLCWIDRYLFALSSCRTTEDPGEHRRRERCVELAAHYLIKTDWFERAPVPKLAHVANKLSKFADRAVCTAALGWVADQLSLAGRLRCLDAKTLALLANALAKAADQTACERGIQCLARRLYSPDVRYEADLSGMLNAQDIANTLNALCKWSGNIDCQQAAWRLARHIYHTSTLVRQSNGQDMSNMLNALSKWPENNDCQQAAWRLARHIYHTPTLLGRGNGQDISNTLNALCKWPENNDCQQAAWMLARRIHRYPGLSAQSNDQELSNMLNALSKWSGNAHGRQAAGALTQRIHGGLELAAPFNGQDISTALNAPGKWLGNDDCQQAARTLARRIHDNPGLLRQFSGPNIAVALNALSKWPEDDESQRAALALARQIHDNPGLLRPFNGQNIVNALNALSKWPGDDGCQQAARALAQWINLHPDLIAQFNSKELSNALNALSKWPEEDHGRRAAEALARQIRRDAGLTAQFNEQDVSNILNALSKWPEQDSSRLAALALAERIADDPALAQQMVPQGLALVLNGLSKWPRDEAIRKAMLLLAEGLGKAAKREWKAFPMENLAMVANALARLAGAAAEDGHEPALVQARLRGLAEHLDTHRQRFEQTDTREIGLLFKSLAAMQLQRALRPLAQPALQRLENLIESTGLRHSDLETLGTLCAGLLPLARSSDLQRHHSAALRVFERLRPIVQRKIELFLRDAHRTSAPPEACDSRCPALSFYLVLKAYAVVQRRWKPGLVSGSVPEVTARRKEIRAWVEATLARTRALLLADLDEAGWNLIAQIEAGEEALDALDLRLFKEAEAITARHPATRVDLRAVRQQMAGAPGAVAAGAGATEHILVDLQGREIQRDSAEGVERPYSLYARLTGLPLVEVKLPGQLSPFMLARTFHYQGEPWRFDLFGGSRLNKGRQQRALDILSGNGRGYGVLPAVRYVDSAPDSDLIKLTAKLAPQREDWSRIQRALLEMVPRDHVIEGTLRLGWFEDVPGEAHPFRLSGPGGEHIALCPNDGCGFLKWEVAMGIPAVRQQIEAWQAVRAGRASPAQRQQVAVHQAQPAAMAPQALQHFPRDDEVIAEARQQLERRLDELAAQAGRPLRAGDLDLPTLYRLLVNGGYEGARVRAVPAADDKVHLPAGKSAAFDTAGGTVLIGKPPYDKENLLPVGAERIATVARGDATARFLGEQCFAIQYSYAGFDDDSGPDPDMLHSKGMLIVPLPGYWSPAHRDLDLACSREDLKSLSRWVQQRDRQALPTRMASTGSLRVKDILLPGSLGALPIAELRKRDMDTDGDDAFVYAGYPELTVLIERTLLQRERRRGQPTSFKPPKTAHPARDDTGRYRPGRAREILDALRGQQLLGTASTAARSFMAQPDDIREAIAQDFMFGTYDGIERHLRNALREQLPVPRVEALGALQAQAEQAIARAHQPEAREAAALLSAEIARWRGECLGAAAAAQPLPEALAERFPALAQAYTQAPNSSGRVAAILDHYPVVRLSHEHFPQGQPGYIHGEPELTARNLFTLAQKVGTDALKTDTGITTFEKIIECYQATEHCQTERVRSVPYAKQTAVLLRDGRFDAGQMQANLRPNSTLAAAVMSVNLETLRRRGLLPPTEAPAARVAAQAGPEAIQKAVGQLAQNARVLEQRVTPMLQTIAGEAGASLAGLAQALKSPASLAEKLRQLIAFRHKTLDEAVTSVNDALRYSVVLPADRFSDGYRHIAARLDDLGHEKRRVANHFTKPQEAFSAVSVTLRTAQGQLWEIQFHTSETFRLKQQFHDLYKQLQWQRLQGVPLAERRERQRPATQAFRALPLPAEVDEIEDLDNG